MWLSDAGGHQQRDRVCLRTKCYLKDRRFDLRKRRKHNLFERAQLLQDRIQVETAP
jgi:hypothetical protein